MSNKIGCSWKQSYYLLVLLLLLICLIFVVTRENAITPYAPQYTVHDKQPIVNESSKTADDWYTHINDTKPASIEEFFRHAKSDRNSSYPFISGDTFRGMADHIFDETTDVNKWPDRVGKINRGDTVFLGTEVPFTKFFQNDTFNKIRHPFVVVTHNSNGSSPTDAFKWVLDHEKILAWFASNPSHMHKRLFPIPIGFANRRWGHGNVDAFKRAFYQDRKPFYGRTILVYLNFQEWTNRGARSKALKWALGLPNTTLTCSISHEIYLKDLGNAKFVLSPPGNGLDCHRTWEALLMGAIPIVLRSRLDPLFFNGAILIVDEWEHITVEYLQSLHHNTSVSNEKLFAKYWRKRLIQAVNSTEYM